MPPPNFKIPNSIFQVYSLFLLVASVIVYLWLEHYISVEQVLTNQRPSSCYHQSHTLQDLSYALPIFLFSLSVSTFCLSLLACCCLVKSSAPAPLGYLVSIRSGSSSTYCPDITELMTVTGQSLKMSHKFTQTFYNRSLFSTTPLSHVCLCHHSWVTSFTVDVTNVTLYQENLC